MRRRYRPTDLDIIQISFAGRPATRRPLLSPPGSPPCGVALSTVALSPSSLFSFLVQPLLLRSLFLRVAQKQKSVHRRSTPLSQADDGSSAPPPPPPPDDVGSAHFCQRDVWISVLFVIIFRTLARSKLGNINNTRETMGTGSPGN